MTDKAKVFVVQENPRINYSDALRYGELIFLTAHEYSPVSSSLLNKELLSSIRGGLASFDHENDYILLAGNLITCGYVFHLVMADCPMDHPKANFLQWNKQSHTYSVVTFPPES